MLLSHCGLTKLECNMCTNVDFCFILFFVLLFPFGAYFQWQTNHNIQWQWFSMDFRNQPYYLYNFGHRWSLFFLHVEVQ